MEVVFSDSCDSKQSAKNLLDHILFNTVTNTCIEFSTKQNSDCLGINFLYKNGYTSFSRVLHDFNYAGVECCVDESGALSVSVKSGVFYETDAIIASNTAANVRIEFKKTRLHDINQNHSLAQKVLTDLTPEQSACCLSGKVLSTLTSAFVQAAELKKAFSTDFTLLISYVI